VINLKHAPKLLPRWMELVVGGFGAMDVKIHLLVMVWGRV
jgi:hypothetical protein